MTHHTLTERGSGRTSRQMVAASRDAFFVGPTLVYFSDLACWLGRGDLRIRSVDWLTRGGWRGTQAEIVIDHGVVVSGHVRDQIGQHNTWLEERRELVRQNRECAACGRRLHTRARPHMSQLQAPERWPLCEECWHEEDDEILREGTQVLPDRIAAYAARIRHHT